MHYGLAEMSQEEMSQEDIRRKSLLSHVYQNDYRLLRQGMHAIPHNN